MQPPRDWPARVEVRAPATVANLGPGFDLLGMALAEPFDTVIAEWSPQAGVTIADITGDGGRLPRRADRNTAGIAASETLRLVGALADAGVRLTIHKGLPLASGLGSSAASAVGAAVAVNALFGAPLARLDLISACLEAEAVVSGRHADNVAPALLGGVVLVTGLTPDLIFALPTPPGLWLALVTPDVAVPTATARAVLPPTVRLPALVQQSAALALLITAIHRGDVRLMGHAMEGDLIIEPARAHLMPGLAQVRAAARDVGAYGTIISGAGPTLCSVCDSEPRARAVAEAMTAVYADLALKAEVRITRPAEHGAQIVG